MAAKATVVSGQTFYEVKLYGRIGFCNGNPDGYFLFPDIPAGQTYVTVIANGMKPAVYPVTLDDQNQEIHFGVPGGPPNTIHFPPLSFSQPSRDKIVNVKANFCNLRDAEDIPIFDPFIDWLITNNPNKAADWVFRLKDADTTHINLDISGDYAENLGWSDRYPIPGTDWTHNLDGFKRILDYVLNRNFIPIIHLAADGQGFDPVGLTYGWQWGMNNVPHIIYELRDYIPLALWNTGWDGCFPNWTPDQICRFLIMMRANLGEHGQIATEFGGPGTVGYSHLGNGGSDWYLPGMIEVDSFFIELNTYPPDNEGVSQTATRLLGPDSLHCPHEPYYLAQPRPRGPMAIIMFETCAYQAIRKQITPLNARQTGNQTAFFGFKQFGNGQPI
jgi:hypothetical protein